MCFSVDVVLTFRIYPCKAHWLLYVPRALTLRNLVYCRTVHFCVTQDSHNKYGVFVMETSCVASEVRAGVLNNI
jgi:hypothetical protein